MHVWIWHDIELLITAQTGYGTMKMYTNCRINLAVDNWPWKKKDVQFMINYLIRSCMSFLSEGQLSTDKIILQFSVNFHIFISIKMELKQELESKLIPVQTGNGTMKIYTNCRINLSVDSLLPHMKDIQLLPYYLMRSCMSFLSGGQLSTDKLNRKWN